MDADEVNRAMRFMRDYLVKRGVHCTIEKMDSGREVLYGAKGDGAHAVDEYVYVSSLDGIAGYLVKFFLEANP